MIAEVTDVSTLAERVRSARSVLEAAVQARKSAQAALQFAEEEESAARKTFNASCGALVQAAGGELPMDLWR